MNPNGCKRILIVDDEEMIRVLLKRQGATLRPGYQIDVAPDGFIALTLLQHQPFDLLLTDHEMPGINGLELAQQVRRTWPDTRIVLMSSYSLPQLLASEGPVDFDGYVQKPFILTQIFDKVEPLIGRKTVKD
jgi:CheY-like chemotaxis protein